MLVPLLILILFFMGCEKSPTNKVSTKNSNIKVACATSGTDLIDCLKFQIKNHRLPDNKILQPLSYCDFIAIGDGALISGEQTDELIDYAYAEDNPILFRVAKEQIPPSSHSLNFLWIHDKKLDEEGHMMAKNDKLLQKNIIDPLIDWQSKQPEAIINFWYDGDMVKNLSVENTKNILTTKSVDVNKVDFRDIRNIALVQENSDLFEEKIPIYFRVDLAKALIADHVIKTDPYAITIDSDVAAVTPKQLFDQKTLLYLRNLGYIFGTGHTFDEENSFIMLYNKAKTNTVKDHQEIVIDKSIKIARKLLSEERDIPPQIVFHQYTEFRINIKKQYRNAANKAWDGSKLGVGKSMIFPPSQFGGGGYSDEEIIVLKRALVSPNGCN